jgi:hypothetical protein
MFFVSCLLLELLPQFHKIEQTETEKENECQDENGVTV